MKTFKFNSIGARLTFWFFLMAMLPLIMVDIAIYSHMVWAMKASIFKNLEAIRDTKVAELNHWLDERIIDIRTIVDDNEMRALERIRQGNENEANSRHNAAIISEARNLLRRYLKHYDDFYEVFIVSPHTEKIIVSTDKEREGQRPAHAYHYKEALKSRSLFIEDIHYSPMMNRACMAFSIPIFSQTGSRVIGVLVARFNLETSLYELLSNRMGLGETGETFIVNKDALVLSKLRWRGDAPLKLKLAAQASLGNTGIVETVDYRGERVLAACTYIPRNRWIFVAKQDLKEVYAPINRLSTWMITIFIATLLGALMVAFRVAKSISNPIKELHKGSEIIGNGNLDHKVGTGSKDEIGELSRTFDLMIENLKAITASRDELNKEIAERIRLERMLLEIREHERRRIGHDLHDNLGQQLTAISFMAQGLENTLKKRSLPEAEGAERITDLIEMAKTQVRSLSTGLSPMLGNDEYSLITAMVDLASNSERMFGIPCSVLCEDNVVRMHNTAALIQVYRIVQEAITNAARHARPKRIEIQISRMNGKIAIAIKDDGTGFIVPDRINSMGMEVMRYRADIINASLDIRSELNKGTMVTCVFPDAGEGDTA